MTVARGLPTPRLRQTGQSMVEYLLALTVILLVLIFAMRSGGPVQSSVGSMLDQSGQKINGAVSAATNRIKF